MAKVQESVLLATEPVWVCDMEGSGIQVEGLGS